MKAELLSEIHQDDIRGQLRVSGNVEIDINCVFEDSVSIGENSTIGHNCYLNRCKIGKMYLSNLTQLFLEQL